MNVEVQTQVDYNHYTPLYVTHVKSKCQLWIYDGGVKVDFPTPMPCLWYRIWYRVLLGWKWKRL